LALETAKLLALPPRCDPPGFNPSLPLAFGIKTEEEAESLLEQMKKESSLWKGELEATGLVLRHAPIRRDSDYHGASGGYVLSVQRIKLNEV
jgi:hypothetical protein